MTEPFILPDWPAPQRVRAAVTTRVGGISRGCYAGLNLGDHTGDLPAAVAENRRLMRLSLGLPAEPAWLSQVHGTRVIPATEAGARADGSWSDRHGEVCAILSADCLPVLFCADDGSAVAAAHAGWRGLAGGVIEACVGAIDRPAHRLLAWLGPAIGPEAFEVGEEVRDAFLRLDRGARDCFQASPRGRWLADLYALARRRLHRLGVERVYGGGCCTYSDAARFYSYRRDGRTGRMASLIWLTP